MIDMFERDRNIFRIVSLRTYAFPRYSHSRRRRRHRLVKRIDREVRTTLHEGNAPGIYDAFAVKCCDDTFATPVRYTFAHKSQFEKILSNARNIAFRILWRSVLYSA